jgi:hypothetical protein
MVAIAKITGLEEKQVASEEAGKKIPMDVKQQILFAIAHVEYGSVEVIIHGGKVKQIECREKVRIS